MSAKGFFKNLDLGMRSTPIETLEKKYCDKDSKFITIDGTRVHYKDHGAGPALVLLHGVVSFLHTWDGWCEELQDHYRIIRLDMPGWGMTGPNKKERYLREDINKFLDAFLDALKIDRCFLAGNSLGAFYAWNYTVHRPEKIEKLLLLDPIAYNQSLPYEFQLVKIPGVKSMIDNLFLPRLFIRTSVQRLYGRKERIAPRVYDQYWENIMRDGNRRTLTKVFKFIAEMSKSDTIYRDIKKIKAPVLMVWGDKDIWSRWSETLEHWKRDLPHAEVILYKDCGHMPMEELPEETARDAHNFFMKDQATAMKKRSGAKKGS